VQTAAARKGSRFPKEIVRKEKMQKKMGTQFRYLASQKCQTIGDDLFFFFYIILGVGKHHGLGNKKC